MTSIQGAIQLFEHSNYGAYTEVFTASVTTMPNFPVDKTGGASAAYLPGPNKWTLYTEQRFDDLSITVDPGFYPSPAAMGFPNDKVQSIKKHD